MREAGTRRAILFGVFRELRFVPSGNPQQVKCLCTATLLVILACFLVRPVTAEDIKDSATYLRLRENALELFPTLKKRLWRK